MSKVHITVSIALGLMFGMVVGLPLACLFGASRLVTRVLKDGT